MVMSVLLINTSILVCVNRLRDEDRNNIEEIVNPFPAGRAEEKIYAAADLLPLSSTQWRDANLRSRRA